MQHKGLFDEFEYTFGKEYAKNLCKLQKGQGFHGINGIKSAFLEFENLGFGKTKIILLQKHRSIIKNANSPIAKQYVKSIFEDKIKADWFMAGVYSGILSSYLNRNIEVSETKCYAEKSEACVFEDSKLVLNKYELNEPIREIIDNYGLVNAQRLNIPNIFVMKLLQGGNYHLKDGSLKVANIPHVFFRVGFFNVSNCILSKVYDDIPNLFRYIGFLQASEIAADFLRNKFGVKNRGEIFKTLITQLNLFGYGKPVIYFKNRKGVEIKLVDSVILRQSQQFMDTFKDPYLEGMVIGAADILQKQVGKMVISILSRDKLILRLKFHGKENLAMQIKEKIKSKLIKKIASERMKHNYYLTTS